jgi:predicted nucleic-acid-binding protein
MKITADTNVLVRALAGDYPHQSRVARAELLTAELIALPLLALCELVWVLAQGYGIPPAEIADAIERLAGAENVAVDRPAVAAGLALLRAGGDFAAGVIAHQGRWLGADAFASFDKRAVRLLQALGETARALR